MSERIAEVVIVAEDLRQGNFVRRYLNRADNSRKLRVEISPKGKGSGEQFVRESYATEVSYYRSRAHHRRAALVIAIDADTETVAEREQQLEEALKKAAEESRGNSEHIALLIPRRRIETWILCLTDEEVNETTDYKSTQDIDRKIKQAAETFFDRSRDNYPVPAHCVASLQKGLKEIRRVD